MPCATECGWREGGTALEEFVMAIDAGTTGVTVLLVDREGRPRHRGYREITQHYPRPGWVEHDPGEIWSATLAAAADALADAGSPPVTAAGITNQRETTLLWERGTLRPVHPAIVWQCRRSAAICDELRARGAEELIRERTGLVADAYFSGTKLTWLMREVPGLRSRAEAGELAFGTVDSWLLARLTGGRVHATDVSNASRTMLLGLADLRWDPELLELLEVPPGLLPEVLPSSHRFGTAEPGLLGPGPVPISGIAGDQQSALFGQACFREGMAKNTYGTGSFVLVNTGDRHAVGSPGILTTVAWGLGGRVDYASEGSVFVTGAAIQWLRDGLGIISSAAETGPLAESVPDTGGVHFVPALAGLGAPYWDPHARGTITGITGGTTRAHLARATVEAMAFQSRDVVDAMTAGSGVAPTELRVDGGASVMDLLCQFQADLLGIPVARPVVRETTAMGAAYLAGIAEGFWSGPGEVASQWRLDRMFEPSMSGDERDARQTRWRKAVDRARGWEA
jgi:glycerol kinase